MKDDELVAKLCPEAIAILQAAITPRIDTADITISSIDDGVIVTTTAAGVYRQQGPPWGAALTELWEHEQHSTLSQTTSVGYWRIIRRLLPEGSVGQP